MKGVFVINQKNTWTNWGVLLADSGLGALLAPPPLKQYVTNKSVLSGGKRIAPVVPKYDDRDLMLEIYLIAEGWTDFNKKLESFYDELAKGFLEVKTARSDKYFHLLYQNCSQFTEFDGRMAKFILSLNEPDPSNTLPSNAL